MAKTIPKGTKIEGPDGQFYQLSWDLLPGQIPTSYHFKAGNGAPEPVKGDCMPGWLVGALKVYGVNNG